MIVRLIAIAAVVVTAVLAVSPAPAQDGRVTAVSRAPFPQVAEALEKAVTEHKMAVVCHANAQRGPPGAAWPSRETRC